MTPLGEKLQAIFREAVERCDAEILTGAALVRDGDSLDVHRHAFMTAQAADGKPVPRLSDKGVALGLSLVGGRAAMIAVGKAARGMSRAVRASLADRLDRGLVIVPEGVEVEPMAGVEVVHASHPLPDESSVIAAEKALALAAALAPEDLLIVAISGGASALMCAPAGGITLAEKIAVTRALIQSGAPIGEINAVRKHLSRIKGGRLAAATKASVLVLALSDVAGDELSVIGSGPASPDSSTITDVAEILVRNRIPFASTLPETPKPADPLFARVRSTVIAGPDHLRSCAVTCAAAAGFLGAGTAPPFSGRDVAGIASGIPDRLAAITARLKARLSKPVIIVEVGEPSVHVTGTPGIGGRSSHLALLVARAISGMPRVSFLAAGSDGIDGSSTAAGAVVDGSTWLDAERRGLDPAGALARFDSARVHDAMGNAIVTGRTHTNLLDLHLLAVEGSA